MHLAFFRVTLSDYQNYTLPILCPEISCTYWLYLYFLGSIFVVYYHKHHQVGHRGKCFDTRWNQNIVDALKSMKVKPKADTPQDFLKWMEKVNWSENWAPSIFQRYLSSPEILKLIQPMMNGYTRLNAYWVNQWVRDYTPCHKTFTERRG